MRTANIQSAASRPVHSLEGSHQMSEHAHSGCVHERTTMFRMQPVGPLLGIQYPRPNPAPPGPPTKYRALRQLYAAADSSADPDQAQERAR